MSYSDIQICNIALTHLGDVAQVASISAPTTTQERYCATMYPLARDITLEKHQWGFATTRAALVASAVAPPSTWQYAYTAPAGVVNYIAVLDPQAGDDYSSAMVYSQIGPYVGQIVDVGAYTPQPFAVENDGTGTGAEIIYCNVLGAVLRYTQSITDATKFPPLFVDVMALRLASMLAGPLLKGDVGIKAAKELSDMADARQQAAEGSDANQRSIKPAHSVRWIAGRG